jgi:multidrug efflux pump subunit AcrB
MASFSIRNPYFIIVICLVVIVLGGVAVLGMPVDLSPRSTSLR